MTILFATLIYIFVEPMQVFSAVRGHCCAMPLTWRMMHCSVIIDIQNIGSRVTAHVLRVLVV